MDEWLSIEMASRVSWRHILILWKELWRSPYLNSFQLSPVVIIEVAGVGDHRERAFEYTS
jgi:hypothetical protein